MLTADVRFEGWTAEDWMRFVQVWSPQRPDAKPSLGGLVIVHENRTVLDGLGKHNKERLEAACQQIVDTGMTPSYTANAPPSTGPHPAGAATRWGRLRNPGDCGSTLATLPRVQPRRRTHETSR